MTATTKGERTRQRMMATTAALMRRQGYHATGLNQIVARSRAPKGSLYFHFPGGKDELAIAALDHAASAWQARLLEAFHGGADLAQTIARVCEALAAELVSSRFANGCPLATVTLEIASENPAVRQLAEQHFRGWEAMIAGRLTAAGIASSRAEELATLVLSSIEGALILARAYADPAPVLRIGAELARLVPQLAAAPPASGATAEPAPRVRPSRAARPRSRTRRPSATR
jgi:TetR/AcrR family transcriptional repressor of lmrAB and yxaGH operons